MGDDMSKNIWAALADAQRNFKPLVATGRNPHFKSDYATLGDIHKATRAALLSAGLVVTSAPVYADAGMAVEMTMAHTDTGETISQRCPLMLSKQDMQGLGSAISYARRYLLLSMLDLDMDGWDDDGEKTKVEQSEPCKITAGQLKALHAVGADLYGDEWDSKHPVLVEHVTAGAQMSSAELLKSEAQTLITGMQKRLASRNKAAQHNGAKVTA